MIRIGILGAARLAPRGIITPANETLGAEVVAIAARNEVRARQWLRIVFKDASVGLINGLAVAATTSLGVFLWSGSPGLCMVIGLAMIMSMALAGLVGASIPLALTAVGQDPAQASSILLTTVTDVFGFFSFLGLATLFVSLL